MAVGPDLARRPGGGRATPGPALAAPDLRAGSVHQPHEHIPVAVEGLQGLQIEGSQELRAGRHRVVGQLGRAELDHLFPAGDGREPEQLAARQGERDIALRCGEGDQRRFGSRVVVVHLGQEGAGRAVGKFLRYLIGAFDAVSLARRRVEQRRHTPGQRAGDQRRVDLPLAFQHGKRRQREHSAPARQIHHHFPPGMEFERFPFIRCEDDGQPLAKARCSQHEADQCGGDRQPHRPPGGGVTRQRGQQQQRGKGQQRIDILHL
jgi:hypothetical protein